MFIIRKNLLWSVFFAAFLLFVPSSAMFGRGNGSGGSGGSKSSEVIVRRVDSNQLIRLRVFIDGKSQGTLRVGETSVFKVSNGYHTMRVGFEDFQQRSTEVAQFRSYNSTHVFSVTDNSIVLVSEEMTTQPMNSPTPIVAQSSMIGMSNGVGGNESSAGLDNAIRSAFDKSTKNIKKSKKIAVLNVDSEDMHEGNFVLEELTLLTVNSPKKFNVIDRRMFDAYRAQNSIGVPTYDNDFMLRYIGSLMGADYVVSGILDGPGDLRRLRVKALDVKTGHLIGDASERL
jgi:hypothetical protein